MLYLDAFRVVVIRYGVSDVHLMYPWRWLSR